MSAPWPKGIHHDYTAFVMEVHVRRDQGGAARSFHCLQDQRDEETTASLQSSGGMEEGAWALLTECVKAEALLQVLVKLSNDAEFQRKMIQTDEVDPGLLENLTKATLEQLHKGLNELLPHVVRETLTTVCDGLRSKNE
jgi:hypothetical protein